jgi:orotate phosphoribosyltransferase
MVKPSQIYSTLRWQPGQQTRRACDAHNVRVLVIPFATVTDHRKQLGDLLRARSLFRGEITLSSGRKSDYYLDCKLTTLHPLGALLTGYSILEALKALAVKPDAIGGLTMGADPLVSATVVVSQIEHKPLPGFLVRKEHKKHGRGKQVEGISDAPRDVVIVDEVCTTGGSTWEAIRAVEAEGYKVAAVIILVDREEDDADGLRVKYKYRAIFTARELLGGSRIGSTEARPAQSERG